MQSRAPGQPRPSTPRELRFDFALPLPDGDFDYERLDTVADLSAASPCPNLTADELRSTLEQLPVLRDWMPTDSAKAIRSTS